MDIRPFQSVMQDQLLVAELRRRLDTGPGLVKAQQLDVPKTAVRAFLEEAPPPGEAAGPGGQEQPPVQFASPLTEAIILQVGRPSLLVRKNSFELPESDVWKGRLYPTKPTLEDVIRSVGRLELRDHDIFPWVGTAWMVTEDVAVTNRHVASEFARKAGKRFTFSRNFEGKPVRALIDFKEEYKQPTSMEVNVKSVIFIEEPGEIYPDIAFLRLERDSNLPPPIVLSTESLSDFVADQDRWVAAIGYPARDSRNDSDVMLQVFGDIYDVKRFAPGRITSARKGFIFTHDCSTLGGNSGSVIVDVATGQALGLHFGGQYRTANFGVKAEAVLSALAKLKIQVPVPALRTRGLGDAPLEEAPAVQPAAYRGRQGYQPDFLGRRFNVPLPTLNTEQKADAVRISRPAEEDESDRGSTVLNYTHYSVTMSGRRRLAYFAASNIDGSQLRRFTREDGWKLDPRIKAEEQVGPSAYSRNNLDKGHLVRRLDPVWGDEATARLADVDTFHYTNACPQHADLNRRSWVDLEDYVLQGTDDNNLRALVFTGPVLRDTDVPYRDIKLPQDYWKVVVIVNSDTGKLSATAYLLSQADLLSNIEEFAFGAFRTYQVSVARIERLTGLDFGKLRRADPMGLVETLDVRVVNQAEDIVL